MHYVNVVKALFDYEAQTPEELSFEADTLLFIVQLGADGWHHARIVNSDGGGGEDAQDIGLIPSNYVEDAEASARANVLWDYEARNDDELTVAEGQGVEVLDRGSDDWWLVRFGPGKAFGLVPAEYLQVTTEAGQQAGSNGDGGNRNSDTAGDTSWDDIHVTPSASGGDVAVAAGDGEASLFAALTSALKEIELPAASAAPASSKATSIPINVIAAATAAPVAPAAGKLSVTQSAGSVFSVSQQQPQVILGEWPVKLLDAQRNKGPKRYLQLSSDKMQLVSDKRTLIEQWPLATVRTIDVNKSDLFFTFSSYGPVTMHVGEKKDARDVLDRINKARSKVVESAEAPARPSRPPARVPVQQQQQQQAPASVPASLGKPPPVPVTSIPVASVEQQQQQPPPPVAHVPMAKRKSGMITDQHLIQVGRVIYDYVPQEEGDLAVKEGDNVVILDDSDPSWWKVQLVAKGRRGEGMVPATYVERKAPMQPSATSGQFSASSSATALPEVTPVPVSMPQRLSQPAVAQPSAEDERRQAADRIMLEEAKRRRQQQQEIEEQKQEELRRQAEELEKKKAEEKAERERIQREKDLAARDALQKKRSDMDIMRNAVMSSRKEKEDVKDQQVQLQIKEQADIVGLAMLEDKALGKPPAVAVTTAAPQKNAAQTNTLIPLSPPNPSDSNKESSSSSKPISRFFKKGDKKEKPTIPERQVPSVQKLSVPRTQHDMIQFSPVIASPLAVFESPKAIAIPGASAKAKSDAAASSTLSVSPLPAALMLESTPPRALPSRPELASSTDKPDPSKTREWTDLQGNFRVEAQFIGVDPGGKVILHKINGVKIAVAVDKLSLVDQDYVKKAELVKHLPYVPPPAANGTFGKDGLDFDALKRIDNLKEKENLRKIDEKIAQRLQSDEERAIQERARQRAQQEQQDAEFARRLQEEEEQSSTIPVNVTSATTSSSAVRPAASSNVAVPSLAPPPATGGRAGRRLSVTGISETSVVFGGSNTSAPVTPTSSTNTGAPVSAPPAPRPSGGSISAGATPVSIFPNAPRTSTPPTSATTTTTTTGAAWASFDQAQFQVTQPAVRADWHQATPSNPFGFAPTTTTATQPAAAVPTNPFTWASSSSSTAASSSTTTTTATTTATFLPEPRGRSRTIESRSAFGMPTASAFLQQPQQPAQVATPFGFVAQQQQQPSVFPAPSQGMIPSRSMESVPGSANGSSAFYGSNVPMAPVMQPTKTDTAYINLSDPYAVFKSPDELYQPSVFGVRQPAPLPQPQPQQPQQQQQWDPWGRPVQPPQQQQYMY